MFLDQLDELEAIHRYDEGKASVEEHIPFEQTVKEIKKRER
jgi:hypothetical protein